MEQLDLRPTVTKKGEFTVKLGEFTIRGRSVGGCETCIIIEELAIAFDMGYQAELLENVQNVFISHGHMDHIGCLQYCHANRALHNITCPWQIVMPQCYIDPFKTIATAFSSLGRGGYPREFQKCTFADGKEMNVIKPFEKMRVSKLQDSETCNYFSLINKTNFFATAFKMKHKIESYGYVIYEKRIKLKDEYKGLSGKEIKALKDQNIDITYDLSLPTIAFTGDTTIDPILANSDFLNAKILIMECTHFPDSDVENAVSHGHVHFQQFVDNLDKFKNNWIVLCHLSQKYRTYVDVEEYLKVIPDDIRKKIVVLV
jgi:ribonuclease Z